VPSRSTGIGVLAVKSVAMPTTRSGAIPLARHCSRHGLAQHPDVILRVLQRPLGRQLGARGGERMVHHGVRVVVDGRPELLVVVRVDDDGAPRERAEIDADDVAR
jgi:hypothetical protein